MLEEINLIPFYLLLNNFLLSLLDVLITPSYGGCVFIYHIAFRQYRGKFREDSSSVIYCLITFEDTILYIDRFNVL